MDILNFISWIKGKRLVTTLDPNKSVIPVGVMDDRRDDSYITGAITVANLLSSISSGPIANIGTSLYSVTPLAGPINTNNVIAFGFNAGQNATNAQSSNFFGSNAGNQATDASSSNFFGINAGRDATQAYNSNFMGTYAGYQATNANSSNFLGNGAGRSAANAAYSNFIGNSAGYNATNAADSNFMGVNAGKNATNANTSNFFGNRAGEGATTANNSNFFGEEAGKNSTGNNVNAFGVQANMGGSLSGQTVFANATIPSYLNYAAAALAITVPLGGVAGNTYLYHDQTNNALGTVRL
jgi:hypothetical protein